MRKRIILVVLLIAVAGAGCTNAKIQADIMAEIQSAADELNAQRQDMAVMQEQIDSLKFALAKQDTLVKKLANLAGIPGGSY